MVGSHVLRGAVGGTADEEQLPHLFLRGEGGEEVVNFLGCQFLFRGLRRRGGFLRLGRRGLVLGIRGGFRRAAGA